MSTPEIAAEAVSDHQPPHVDRDKLPPLYEDRGFWGLTVTQFLGAFNDNLFKQLVLLLSIIPAAGAAAGSGEAQDRQGAASIVFALPFLLFTGYAGYLADRNSKRTIIVLAKVAEIVVMGAGAVAFAIYASNSSLAPLYIVLFLMAAQSAFFGPAKYGILPEMLRDTDLPRANGLMLTTTFMAIILGQFLAGMLLEFFPGRLWVGSTTCIVLAVAGTLTSLWVRKLRPAVPHLKFERDALWIPADMRAMLRADRPLLAALWVSSVFWLLAAMVNLAVNALGKIDYDAGNDKTSYLVAIVSVGIAIGGWLGGVLSKGQVDFRVLRIGAFGMMSTLIVLGIPTVSSVARPGDSPSAAASVDDAASESAGEQSPSDDGRNFADLPGVGDGPQWLGFVGSMGVLTLLGMFTGFFAIPLQVFMQSRPPDDKKGRMVAAMNLFNWVGVILGGVLYEILARVLEALAWPRCVSFLLISCFMLPIALFYHPKNEALSND